MQDYNEISEKKPKTILIQELINYKESFSVNLKAIRRSHGLSLSELASMLPAISTRASLYDWEHKRAFPSIENLIALTNLFGISLEWLLGRSSDIYTEQSVCLGEIALYTEIDNAHINCREVGEGYRQDFLKVIELVSNKRYLNLDDLTITDYSKPKYPLSVRGELLVLLRLVSLEDLYWAYHYIFYGEKKRGILALTKKDFHKIFGRNEKEYKGPSPKAQKRAVHLAKLLMYGY